MKNNPRSVLKVLIIIIAAIVIIGYALFNSRLLVLGPQIIVEKPIDGSSFDTPFIVLEGTTQNISFISLDDRPIFVDEDGVFREKLLLSPGLSIIELYGRDRFDRETTIYVRYVYTGEEVEPSLLPTPEDDESATSTEDIVEEDE